ncbi:MAG: acetolactate decarboxylase [Phycisphaerae bacterium]|nr:acetolactate decarboxylase [Phycisphaerae bacterium]
MDRVLMVERQAEMRMREALLCGVCCWAAGVVLCGCAQTGRHETLYQVSTLAALMDGRYDGLTTVADLRTRGDLGIGCFHALDGEMILLDGRCFRVSADGQVRQAGPRDTMPFAAVTFFEAEKGWPLAAGWTFEQCRNELDSRLPTANLPYAIRITGRFAYVKTRSVPRQAKPYPPLVKVAEHQPTFEFRDVEGVMVGFRLPEYLSGVNMAGYHLHFLTADRTGGGHVLDFTAEDARIEIDDCSRFDLVLPTDEAFGKADLSKANRDVETVER